MVAEALPLKRITGQLEWPDELRSLPLWEGPYCTPQIFVKEQRKDAHVRYCVDSRGETSSGREETFGFQALERQSR